LRGPVGAPSGVFNAGYHSDGAGHEVSSSGHVKYPVSALYLWVGGRGG
jgi:hypothetical protein